jgi:hypothetical protein
MTPHSSVGYTTSSGLAILAAVSNLELKVCDDEGTDCKNNKFRSVRVPLAAVSSALLKERKMQ